jgi:tRNA (mo5U34)-methyltransferase
MASDVDEIARLAWFHSIDLGNGIVTAGKKSTTALKCEAAAYFDTVDLSGVSFLDVGTWDGANAFEARRRGAARIVAQDSFVWKKRKAKLAFRLARRMLGMEDIEDLELDIFDFTPDRPGKFDVVLFAGVFYHLYDPILGLQIVSKCAKTLLILETILDQMDIDRPAMVFYPGSERAGDKTNWWGPNAQCVVDLLKSNGFAKIKFNPHPIWHDRGIFHARRI